MPISICPIHFPVIIFDLGFTTPQTTVKADSMPPIGRNQTTGEAVRQYTLPPSFKNRVYFVFDQPQALNTCASSL